MATGRRFWAAAGQTMTEYAIIVGGIILALAGALTLLRHFLTGD